MAVRRLRKDEEVLPLQDQGAPSPGQPTGGQTRVRPLREGEEVIRTRGRGEPTPRRRQQPDESLMPPSPTSPVAGGELALTFGTGMVAEPVAGLIGLGSTVYDLVRGEDDVLSTADRRIQQVREALTFMPRTEGGRQLARGVSAPFQALTEAADFAGEATSSVAGPEAGAAVRTTIEAGPSAFGFRGVRARGAQRRRDVRRGEQAAREVGVDMRETPEVQANQLVDRAQERTGGAQPGEAMPEVVNAVKTARDQMKSEVDALYADARRRKAGLRARNARGLPDVVRSSLNDFDVQDMPVVKRRLAEIQTLKELPENSVVKLEALQNWRKRINKNRPKKSDRSQNAALDIMKAELDRYLENKFNADMISGDEAAIRAWREATAANKAYREVFSDNRVIRQLAEQDATPETVRSWVFGASAVGAKSEAADVVKRIKNIVGPDSPQFTAIRQEALLDIMEPILRERPNIKQFVRNYDRFVRKNPSLVKEIFPDSEDALKRTRDIASAIMDRDPRTKILDLNRAASVAMFGHGLAKKSLLVRTARKGLEALRAARGKSAKRQMLAGIFGYDAGGPVLPKDPVIIGGSIQTGENISETLEDDQFEE